MIGWTRLIKIVDLWLMDEGLMDAGHNVEKLQPHRLTRNQGSNYGDLLLSRRNGIRQYNTIVQVQKNFLPEFRRSRLNEDINWRS